MADPFSGLPYASFDSIQFPITRIVVKGGLRNVTHEYPHSPGGSPEKLGRKLYTFQLSALFHANLLPPWDENLWPGDLSDLFDRFEEGVTSDLVIPTLGTIKAFCTNWSKEMNARVRTGESAELEFLEDQSSAFLVEGLINVKAQSLTLWAGKILTDADALGFKDVFQAIADAVASIARLADQAEMYNTVLMSKVEAVNHAFARANATVGLLNDPNNAVLLETFLTTWSLTAQLHADLARQAVVLVPFVVPGGKSITVNDVSRIVYGDTSRAVEILQLNAIEDPFRILPNTRLRVYRPDPLARAA